MKEYPKIESLFERDEQFKFIVGKWRLPVFEYLADCSWQWTEKVDGTNIRVCWDGNAVTFGGRTDNAQVPCSLLAVLQELFPAEKFKSLYPDTPMTLFGEGYGAKIQKGGGNYKADGVSFALFDVLVGKWWLERPNVEDVAGKLACGIVPVIGGGTLWEAVSDVQTGNGIESQWGKFQAEGIVLRPMVGLFDRNGHRIIAKIKHKDFK